MYLSIIALEAGLFFYVKGGLDRYKVPIQDVIRGDFSGAKSISVHEFHRRLFQMKAW
jgi:hypothetical protein